MFFCGQLGIKNWSYRRPVIFVIYSAALFLPQKNKATVPGPV